MGRRIALRALEVGDYDRGYMALLSQLTSAPSVSREEFSRRFSELSADYVVVVATCDERVVGSATLLVERKFIRGCGCVAHVEDVVVDSAHRGSGVGRLLVQHLVDESKRRGCYKVILDCSSANVRFYERFGFELKDQHMALYF